MAGFWHSFSAGFSTSASDSLVAAHQARSQASLQECQRRGAMVPTYQVGGQRLLQSDDAWLVGSLETDGHGDVAGSCISRVVCSVSCAFCSQQWDESTRARAQYVQVTMQLVTCWSLRAWQAGTQECRKRSPHPLLSSRLQLICYFVRCVAFVERWLRQVSAT